MSGDALLGVQTLYDTCRRNIAKVKTLERELASQHQQHQAELASQRQKHQAELASLQQRHREDLASRRQQFQAEIDFLRRHHAEMAFRPSQDYAETAFRPSQHPAEMAFRLSQHPAEMTFRPYHSPHTEQSICVDVSCRHIIADLSHENCQLQCRNERLSMENVDLRKSFQSLHDPRSWIRSDTEPEISTLAMVLSAISPNVEKVKRISNELEKLRTIVPKYLISSNASTEQVLQQLLGDQERLCAEQRDLEGKILLCEEVVGPLLYTIFQKVKASMLASEMDGE